LRGTSHLFLSVFDAAKNLEFGSVYGHESAVNALDFFGDTHLVSGGEDGQVLVWRCSDWNCMARLKGHSGAVSDLSVHPTGLVALSVGTDSTLRIWDLARGALALTHRIATPASIVRWSPDGETFVVVAASRERRFVSDNELTVYSSNGKAIKALTLGHRIASVCFLTSSLVALGCEDGRIRVADTQETAIVGEALAHGSRTRVACASPPRTDENKELPLLFSASSDGEVKLWQLSKRGQSLQEIARTAGRVRITAICGVGSHPPPVLGVSPSGGLASAHGIGTPPGKSVKHSKSDESSNEDGKAALGIVPPPPPPPPPPQPPAPSSSPARKPTTATARPRPAKHAEAADQPRQTLSEKDRRRIKKERRSRQTFQIVPLEGGDGDDADVDGPMRQRAGSQERRKRPKQDREAN
jgi:WD40 repeat protein